jgi:hypothetical protein
MNEPDDAVELEVVILEENELAVFVDYGGRCTWLPKSLIELDPTRSDADSSTEITLPRWLAESKGMV